MDRTSKKIGLRLALLAALIAVCVLVSPIRQGIASISKVLYSGDVEKIASFVSKYGKLAAVISFLLMMLQSVLAPIPAFLITFANAYLFGWWKGALLSWSSAMAGAALCFALARFFGRDLVEKFSGGSAPLEKTDAFFRRYGKWAILIARLLPFISFDLVSYAAGLTGMGFVPFFVATGIGQLPATIAYSYVGGMLTGGVRTMVMALSLLFAFSALVYLVRKMVVDRRRRGDEACAMRR